MTPVLIAIALIYAALTAGAVVWGLWLVLEFIDDWKADRERR